MSEVPVQAGLSATGLYACFTVDDVAAGDGHRIHYLLDWLDELDLRATFFVIPFSYANQATLDEDLELVAALRQAAERGHEFQPHGYDHELFECGLPDLMCIGDDHMLSRVARTLSREEFQLRHSHTRGMIGARIARSLRVLQTVFGEGQRFGFRSGYHEFCRELYFALETCRVQYSSSRTATPAAWRRQVIEDADEVVPWVGLLPYWVGDILEVPHLADYGSHIPHRDIDDWVYLAERHLAACEEARAPFVSVSHQPGLACFGDAPEWKNAGYESHARVIDMARRDFGAEYLTLGEVVERALATPHYWAQRDEYRR